jgi:hypothetical protein
MERMEKSQVLECFKERMLGTCQFLYLLHLMALVARRSLNCSQSCIDGVRYAGLGAYRRLR